MAANRCIGRDNRMPWHLPADLAHFKRTTMGAPVIMGRRTYDSILASLGKPLPGRTSVVLSRDLDYRPAGAGAAVVTADSPAAALTAARATGASEAFVIGGAEIYRAMLPACERLVITEIGQSFEGDAFFPALDPAQWREMSRAQQPPGGEPPLDFSFVEYARRTPT
jgi:dihydrofolate reductase